MAHEIKATVEIAAPPEVVWAHLTDLETFASWNPFMVEASGMVVEGEKLRIRMQQPDGPALTFRPTVTESESPHRFEWLGSVLVRGIFDGRHRFELEPTDGGTHLTQSERFTGLAVPLLKKSVDTNSRAAFESMNQALKERVESAMRKPG